jgi:hypothetical protein
MEEVMANEAADLSELLPALEPVVEAPAVEVPAPKYSRREHDAYDTDPICALACVEWIVKNFGTECQDGTFLDPCGGEGPFVRAWRQTWPTARIGAIDIRPEVETALKSAGADFVAIRDFREVPASVLERVDAIVTNPPFVLAEEMIRWWHAGARDGAVLSLLLNCTFMAGQDRWDEARGLYSIAPLHSISPIVPRPAFLVIDGKKTSGKFEAALFTFVKGENHKLLDPVRWEKPKKLRKKREMREEAKAVIASLAELLPIPPVDAEGIERMADVEPET